MARILALIALLLVAAPARADQEDARLPALFERLKLTDNPFEAQQATFTIWSIWIESGDGEIDALVDEGQDAAVAGELDRAILIFTQVIERRPRYAEGWNRRATYLYMAQRYEESAADVAQVLALEPRHFGALSGLGLIRMEQGDLRAALDAFERALAVNPHLPGARVNIDQIRRRLDASK